MKNRTQTQSSFLVLDEELSLSFCMLSVSSSLSYAVTLYCSHYESREDIQGNSLWGLGLGDIFSHGKKYGEELRRRTVEARFLVAIRKPY